MVWLIVSTSVGSKRVCLKGGDLLLQQLVCHGDLSDFALEMRDHFIAFVVPAFLHGGSGGRQGALAPLRQPGHHNVQLAGNDLQLFAAQ